MINDDDAYIDFSVITYKEAKKALDKYYFQGTMKECKYNQSKAAKKLGISRGTFRNKLEQYFGSEYFRDTE